MPTQERDRIRQIGVQRRVVPNHGDHRFVINQRRAQHAETVALLAGGRESALLDQTQRLCRHQQTLGSLD